MSFIYEALKRAEDDNQQRVTAPVGPEAAKTVLRGHSRWWMWALIGVLGANAVAVGAWIVVRRQSSGSNARVAIVDVPKPVHAVVPAPIVSAPVVPAPVVSAPVVPPKEPPAPSVAPSSRVATPNARAVDKPRAASAPPVTVPPVTAPPVTAPAAPRAAAEPRSRAVAAPLPSAEPPSDRGAPASAAAPRITLQVLVYAETPAQRMVFIDGRRFAEGDPIDAETVLERINADGVVVNRRGQRFVISERRP